jgi:hypothetical protein
LRRVPDSRTGEESSTWFGDGCGRPGGGRQSGGRRPTRSAHGSSAGLGATSTRARGDGGPTASGSFHAIDCVAQVVECCVGNSCTIRCSAVSRETRPSHRR